jgi:uncharacterized protein (TIGR02996 family)
MNDDVFLQAILLNPDDESLRLIYADWLEERGDPRGEFIRVQCTLAKLVDGDPRRTPLQSREQHLLNKHGEEWLGPLRGRATRWEFRRGFVEVIAVTPEVYLLPPDTLLQLAPIRRFEVDLTGFTVPPAVLELVPESLARENMVLPLGRRDRSLVVAVANPGDRDLLLKLEFIFNQDIEAVTAPAEQIVEAIGRDYGQAAVESVDTVCFFGDTLDLDMLAGADG